MINCKDQLSCLMNLVMIAVNNKNNCWMSTNIWTLWPMCIKLDTIWKKLKIDTIVWLVNCKANLMRSKRNVKRLKVSLKNWKKLWRRIQFFQGLEWNLNLKWLKSGKIMKVVKTRRCISLDCRILLYVIGWLIKKKLWRKENSWLTVCIWSILSS